MAGSLGRAPVRTPRGGPRTAAGRASPRDRGTLSEDARPPRGVGARRRRGAPGATAPRPLPAAAGAPARPWSSSRRHLQPPAQRRRAPAPVLACPSRPGPTSARPPAARPAAHACRSTGRSAVRIRCGPQMAIGTTAAPVSPGQGHGTGHQGTHGVRRADSRLREDADRLTLAEQRARARRYAAAGAARSTGTCRIAAHQRARRPGRSHTSCRARNRTRRPAAPGGEPDQQEVQEADVGADQHDRAGGGERARPRSTESRSAERPEQRRARRRSTDG